MKNLSTNDRKSKLRLTGRDCSQHDRLDRAALPPKPSYPKGPITVAVPGRFRSCGCTPAERFGGAIRKYSEITGIGPYDWQYYSPVQEAYQSRMTRPDDTFCAFLF